MKFLLLAYDHTDPDCLSRRMACREKHLADVCEMKARGEIVIGGALLDEHGSMIGSSQILDFADRAALDVWLKQEPYFVNRVWDKIQIYPYLVPKIFEK